MGRFYQTSKAQMLDFSLRLPEEMMIGAVQFNDAMINQKLEQFDFLSSQLQGNALTAEHDEILKDIFDKFGTTIDRHTEDLRGNPLDWRNYSQYISETGKEIFKESTEGQWGQIQGVYNQFHSWKASMDEMVKKDPDKFRNEDAAALTNYIYNQYGSGLTEGGKIAGLATEGLAEYFDPVEYGIDLAKGWKADAHTEYWAGSDGRYIRKTIDAIEIVSAQEVYDEIYRSLQGNAKFQSYYSQQFRVQGLEGLPIQVPVGEDSEGNPIYEEQKLSLSKYLDMSAENAAMTAARKEGYTKTETGITDLKVDDIYLEGVKTQGRIQLARVKNELAKDLHNHKETYGKLDLSAIVTSTDKAFKLFTPDKFNPEYMAEFTENLSTDISKLEGDLEKAKFMVQLAEAPGSVNRENLNRWQEAIYNAYVNANRGGDVTVDQEALMRLKENVIGIEQTINDNQIQLNNLNNLQAKAYGESWDELIKKGTLHSRDKEAYEYYQKNKEVMEQAKIDIVKLNPQVRNYIANGRAGLDVFVNNLGKDKGTLYYEILMENGMLNYSPRNTEKRLNAQQQEWYNTNSELNAAIMPVMAMNHIQTNPQALGVLNNVAGEGRIVNSLYLEDDKLTYSKKAGWIGRRNRVAYSLNDLVTQTGIPMEELIASYNTAGRHGSDNIIGITLNEEAIKNAGHKLDNYNIQVRYGPTSRMGDYITEITTQTATPLTLYDKRIVEMQSGDFVPTIFSTNLLHLQNTNVITEEGRTTNTVRYRTNRGAFDAVITNVPPTKEGVAGYTTVSYFENGERMGFRDDEGNVIYTPAKYDYNDIPSILADLTCTKDGYTFDDFSRTWNKVGANPPITSSQQTTINTSSTTTRN